MKVAEMTIRTMERCVPASVPGIVFLSGGLSEEAASVYLNNMNTLYRKALWNVSFSYGRDLHVRSRRQRQMCIRDRYIKLSEHIAYFS